MSLPIAIIKMQARQKEIANGPSFFRKLWYLVNKSKKLHDEEQLPRELLLLSELIDELRTRIREDNYENLVSITEKIDSFPCSSLPFYLNDIKIIISEIENLKKSDWDDEEWLAEFAPFKIADINQNNYRQGTSKGDCLGFAYAMVCPDFSPFLNPTIDHLYINEAVTHFSQNQDHPDEIIRRSRLTRMHFCPNLLKQAEEIYEFAHQHRNKHLLIGTLEAFIRSKTFGGHALYISVQENNDIWYMDSNYSAYIFKNPEDFYRFYVLSTLNTSPYTRKYQISELVYDPAHQYTEPFTLEGKLRTLLTGPKYNNVKDRLLWSLVNCLVLISISYLAAFILTSFIPIALIENVFSILFISVSILSSIALIFFGGAGLLGIPQFFKECAFDIREGSDSESTATILEQIKPNKTAIPENNVLEPMTGSSRGNAFFPPPTSLDPAITKSVSFDSESPSCSV